MSSLFSFNPSARNLQPDHAVSAMGEIWIGLMCKCEKLFWHKDTDTYTAAMEHHLFERVAQHGRLCEAWPGDIVTTTMLFEHGCRPHYYDEHGQRRGEPPQWWLPSAPGDIHPLSSSNKIPQSPRLIPAVRSRARSSGDRRTDDTDSSSTKRKLSAGSSSKQRQLAEAFQICAVAINDVMDNVGEIQNQLLHINELMRDGI